MSEKNTDKINESGNGEEIKISPENTEQKLTEEKTETAAEQKSETEVDFQKKYNEINDKYLRLYSDFDNFRKRNAKEKIELIKYAGEDIIIKLLPVVDDFERAIKSRENSEENKSMADGYNLIFQKLKNILTAQGLKEMDLKEGDFNSDLHEAITKISVEDKKQKGKIMDVIEKGYYLNDKVIRHAKVVVGE